MKRISIRTILIVLVVLAPTTLFAQAAAGDPVAVLEYFDDDFELQIFDSNGFDVNFYVGMGLSPGDQIITADTAVEIRLEPNGSIIRVAPNSEFTVGTIQGRNQAQETSVVLGRGRARMVAARIAGADNRYRFRTPGAVAGVRGTDFGLIVAEGTEELFVRSGEVVYEAVETGEQIFVTGGQRADIFAGTFLPESMSMEEIADRMRDLEFVQLNPADVPGNEVVLATDEEQPEEAIQEEPPEEPEEEEAEAEDDGGLLGRVAAFTGLEVGSITLNEETWAQVVVQPQFSIGAFNVALYLPITYTTNLFDGSQWYRPGGNNEWSFGFDKDWAGDPLEALADFGTDLALKVRYVEYGQRGDPLFLKIGNLSNFTIGQGLLMRNYANDIDFPVVRRIGFNLGLDLEKWGFEGIVNDLSAPEIYGGRLYFRPAAPAIPAAVGLSTIADVGPGRSIVTTDRSGNPLPPETAIPLSAADETDPIFVNVAADLELPVIERERLAMIAFAEAGGLIPYLREGTDLLGSSVNSGLKTDALVDFSSGELKNFGWTTGVRGTFTLFDYRLEFRNYDGVFRPGFYGPNYDRLRGSYAAETVAYLADTENEEYQKTVLGINGELGAELLGALYISGGYFWPWEITESGNWEGSSDDEFTLEIALREGLIPFGIQTGFLYRRTHFAATIAGWGTYSDATLFDAYTSLDAYVAYPLTPAIDLVASISTAVVRNRDGDIIYDSDGQPRVAPTFAIQTRIGL